MKLVVIPLLLEKLVLNPPKPRHINKTLNYVLISDKLEFLTGNYTDFETFLTTRKLLSHRNREVHYQHNNHKALVKALKRDDKYHFLLSKHSDRYKNYLMDGTLGRKELLRILEMEFKLYQSKEENGKVEDTMVHYSQHAFVIYYHYLSVYDSKLYPKLALSNVKEVVQSRIYRQYIGSVRYEGVKKHLEDPFPMDRKNIAYTVKALNEAISIAHRERNERIADTLIRKLSKVHATYMDIRGIHEDDIAS